MAQEELGRCNSCRVMEGEPHNPDCRYDVPEKDESEHCQECGERLKGMYDVIYCTEHLSGQPLVDYAANLKECRDGLIGENRSLQNKIDGAVEHVKEQNSQIEGLKKGFNRLVDLMNRLTADSLGIKGE